MPSISFEEACRMIVERPAQLCTNLTAGATQFALVALGDPLFPWWLGYEDMAAHVEYYWKSEKRTALMFLDQFQEAWDACAEFNGVEAQGFFEWGEEEDRSEDQSEEEEEEEKAGRENLHSTGPYMDSVKNYDDGEPTVFFMQYN